MPHSEVVISNLISQTITTGVLIIVAFFLLQDNLNLVYTDTARLFYLLIDFLELLNGTDANF